MTTAFQRARQLWDQDIATAIIDARLHRNEMPPDLLEQVAVRNKLIKDQAEQLRTAQTANDRVNTMMASIGGSTSPTPALGMAPMDPDQHMFESMICLATIDLPDLPADSDPVIPLAEKVLLGEMSDADFWSAILPPEHRNQVEALLEQLKLIGIVQPKLARLFVSLPRLIGAIVLPLDRLAVVAAALGIDTSGAKLTPSPSAIGEQTARYEVVLESSGDKKVSVIKAVREFTALGLAEAKQMVDAAPQRVKGGITHAQADNIAARLRAAGAVVRVKQT